MKAIITLLVFLPLIVLSQNNTDKTTTVKPALDDCPTWSNKPKRSSKSDYFKYLSQGSDKKTERKTIQNNRTEENTTASVKKNEPIIKKEVQTARVVKPAEGESHPVPVKEEPAAVPVIEKEKQDPEPIIADKEEGSGNSDAAKQEPVKKKESKFKKKMKRIFSRKNNKIAKPNYKKCSTSF